jgi:hypothetical protein
MELGNVTLLYRFVVLVETHSDKESPDEEICYVVALKMLLYCSWHTYEIHMNAYVCQLLYLVEILFKEKRTSHFRNMLFDAFCVF